MNPKTRLHVLIARSRDEDHHLFWQPVGFWPSGDYRATLCEQVVQQARSNGNPWGWQVLDNETTLPLGGIHTRTGELSVATICDECVYRFHIDERITR